MIHFYIPSLDPSAIALWNHTRYKATAHVSNTLKIYLRKNEQALHIAFNLKNFSDVIKLFSFSAPTCQLFY